MGVCFILIMSSSRFFFVTRHSLYQVAQRDVSSSPVVMKMAVHTPTGRNGAELRNPVGGVFRTGYYVGIGPNSIFKFDVTGNPVSGERPELKRGIQIGSRSGEPIALFLSRGGRCEECFETLKNPGLDVLPFDVRWQNETIEALQAIGFDHPFIIMTRSGKYALPDRIKEQLV